MRAVVGKLLWLLARLKIQFQAHLMEYWRKRRHDRWHATMSRGSYRSSSAHEHTRNRRVEPLNHHQIISFLLCRRRRLLGAVTRFLLVILLFALSITHNLPWQRQHLSIVSTTLFPNTSTTYPANTMAVLFNAQKRVWPPWPLVCVSRNATHNLKQLARVRYAFTPIWICGWSVYLAVCRVVERPVEFGIRDIRPTSRTVSLPYRKARRGRLGVVSCFSPLFYNERWQLIIPTLEIYRQLGVDLQVYYVQSMLEKIVKFLLVYQKRGVVRVEGWNSVSIRMPDGSHDPNLAYDPNTEEAAEFVIVSDIDDVLIPRLGETFIDEFRFLSSRYPLSAAGFSYNRYNTELLASAEPHDFSLLSLINGARVATEWEDPKYVVKASHVQTAWLHWPGIVDWGRMYVIPNEWNFMLHFRNWSMIDYFSSLLPRRQRVDEFDGGCGVFNEAKISDVISPRKAAQLNLEFRRFLQENEEAGQLFEQLPRQTHYYPLIAECYNRIFYSMGKRPQNCPGPQRCILPSIKGLRCAVSERRYEHAELNSNVFVHFSRDNSRFVISDTGCKI